MGISGRESGRPRATRPRLIAATDTLLTKKIHIYTKTENDIAEHATPHAKGPPRNSRKCNCSRQDRPIERSVSALALADIRRNCRRSMAKYRKLAKALISGEVGFEEIRAQS
jgi:hypothetical protein